ncbi:MAG TPA: sulfotransferase [Bacteroidetes bacterium]|nr:sulfotransferase [Bacteroidota bacterium]
MALIKQPGLHIRRTSMLKGINGFGKTLKKIGLDPFKLDADAIIAKARKRAGFDGPMPGHTETGMRILIKSIKEEGGANPFGALAAKTLFERTLYGRFKMEQVLAANPDIEKAEIKEPVFIIGMPRTGTTILHAMMHEDPANRSPLAWECLLPYPAPKPETFEDNDQIKRVTKDFEQLFKLVPDFQLKHYMTADSPQECLSINALDFNSFQPTAQFYLPSYMDWFHNRADKLETMRFHKRFLQYLQSGGVKSERWLLKTPVHLMRLPELFEVYPDARIIMTHRHPAKVVASTASLISSVRSLYGDHEDPIRTGQEQAEIWSMYFERFMESRKKLNKEDQIIDLKFDDFVKDQIGVVKKIYDRFDMHLSDEALAKFKHFLDQNPKDKKGVHVYTLEDFGLKEEEINRQYAHYIDFINEL